MILYLCLAISCAALFFAGYLISRILNQAKGTAKMQEIAQAIEQGAMAFLKREFRVLVPVLIILAGVLIWLGGLGQGLAFIFGAAISALAGYIGLRIATQANVRTTQAACKNLSSAFQIAFSSGAVMGMSVVGFGLLGVVLLQIFFNDSHLLISYAFGSSLIALFLRVGGGIYTKSADVGADLVGKVEKGIPEDDPRNPAVIADAVGDNVGDIAGMGSDLFESYISAVVASMVLGLVVYGAPGMILPIALAGAGILASMLGFFFVRLSKKLKQANFQEQTEQVRRAMSRGIIISNLLMIGAAYFITINLFGQRGLFYACLAGLLVGFCIGQVTEYYTSDKRKPVLNIARASETGPSTNIIEGLSLGMLSVFWPVLGVALAMMIAFHFAGLYGIAIASVGILAVLGINLSADCYGPIVDNAAGIAQMAGLPAEVRQRTDALDAVGNTTAAMGKGFAIGSAALAALAWLAAFYQAAQLESISLMEPAVMAGLFIGAMMPFVFSALALKAVSQGGFTIVKEVRRQFQEIPNLMTGQAKPDYAKCVDLTTQAALKQMVWPSLLVVLTPLLVGILLGLAALGALLAGALASGLLLAITMANAGGAWDNAKKYIEAGHLGGKGSAVHQAAVVGDTVGDPFKDTAGPSLNILIKIIGKVALIFIPLFLLLG